MSILQTVRSLAVASLLGGAVIPESQGVDWPRFRGPDGTGWVQTSEFSPDVAGRGMKVWTAGVGDGYSGITISGGRAFTLGNEKKRDVVICLDAATGHEIWRHTYPADPGSYPGPRASPWVEDNRVYTVGYWGDVCCLDAASGTVIWQSNIAKESKAEVPRWGQAGSPLIEGNAMYLNMGEHGCAVDKMTGRILWASGGGASGYSTPIPVVHAGRPHLALFGAKFLHLVDAATGKVAARHPWETSYDVNAADPTPVGDRIFISSGYKKGAVLLEFDGPRPRVHWQNETIRAQFSSAILLDGHLYACDGNTGRGDLVCMHAETGREVWREKLGFGSLIIVNQVIVYLNEAGDLILAKAHPSRFEQLGRADALVTGGKAWTAPSYAGGRLYLRNSKGAVACIRAAE